MALVCPFCGASEDERDDMGKHAVVCTAYLSQRRFGNEHVCQCNACGASGPICDSNEDAIEAFLSVVKRHVHALDGHKVPDYARIMGLMKDKERLVRELSRLKRTLLQAVDRINEVADVRMSGWLCLLKAAGEDGFALAGIVNPDVTPEDDFPEAFDLVLPIPSPDSVREFEGF